MGGLDAAVHLDHLEEASRAVPQPRGGVVDVQHRRIEAALEICSILHGCLPG